MVDFALMFVVCVLAGALQAAVGFGFGLVAVALLALFFDIKEASVLLVIAGLSLNAYVFFRLRRHFRFDRMVVFLLAAVVGVPLGVLFLVHADPVRLKQILGGLLLLSGVQRLIPNLARQRWHPIRAGGPCGLFSGALAGAFGTGGPPAVIFVASQQFDKFRWVATMQAVFGISAVIRLLSLSSGGVLGSRQLLLSACGGAGAVLGAWFGLFILRFLPTLYIKWIVTVMLFVLGVQFLTHKS